ncbi:hypothetical protein [Clavibacter michiganensis]|uniref:hypothetical protein n=1 Tax=Clavibacter michiganensis TaxID=28447 RepID=UPI002E117A59
MLPAVVLVLGLCLGAVQTVGQQVVLTSAAEEAARSVGRGEDAGHGCGARRGRCRGSVDGGGSVGSRRLRPAHGAQPLLARWCCGAPRVGAGLCMAGGSGCPVDGDIGSGTVVAVGVLGAVTALALATVAVSSVLVERAAAAGARTPGRSPRRTSPRGSRSARPARRPRRSWSPRGDAHGLRDHGHDGGRGGRASRRPDGPPGHGARASRSTAVPGVGMTSVSPVVRGVLALPPEPGRAGRERLAGGPRERSGLHRASASTSAWGAPARPLRRLDASDPGGTAIRCPVGARVYGVLVGDPAARRPGSDPIRAGTHPGHRAGHRPP